MSKLMWERLPAAIYKVQIQVKMKGTKQEMKKTSFKTSIFISFLLIFQAISGLSSAAQESTKMKAPGKVVKIQPGSRHISFAVSARAVCNRLKHGRKVMLVDIRQAAEFEKVRIPGAINIPLHAVKTKAFLKSRPFVLVNEGVAARAMKKECEKLKKLNFKPSFLDGGIIAWQKCGGRLEGDLLRLKAYRFISPRTFAQEKDRGDIQIIDLSEKQSDMSRQLVPRPIHISGMNGLARMAEKKGSANTIFVFLNHTDIHYRMIERIMNKTDAAAVFYLDGGLTAYGTFVEHISKPKTNRKRTTSTCRPCIQAQEEKTK